LLTPLLRLALSGCSDQFHRAATLHVSGSTLDSRTSLSMRSSTKDLTATSWAPERELALAEWLEYGRRFGTIGRGVAWWIGDWLRYGNTQYGEKYVRAARVTGYDPQSLMNMVYVASRFDATRRRGKLSWSHHAEVAALGPADQDDWLDLVERERLSVRSLRLELRASRATPREQPTAGGSRGTSSGEVSPARPAAYPKVVCPRCLNVIDTSVDEIV